MKKTTLSIAILAFFLLLSGCGTDEYQLRLDKGASSANSGSKFASVLGAETTIPGAPPNTSVSLRIPTAMPSMDINDPTRGKCPLLELPSLKATYEGFVKYSNDNKMHFYLYVCVSEQGQNNLIPTRNWLNELRAKFPAIGDDSSSDVNKSYSVATPEGSNLQWEEFHVKCPQKFYYTKPDDSQINQDITGTMVCLCRAENGVLVSLIFRYPSDFEERHSTDFDSEWIKLVAGCLKIGSSGG